MAGDGEFLSGWARTSVEIPKEGGRVDLKIPGASIRGRVVDEQGAGLERALVNVAEVTVATRSGPRGEFEFHGLEEGKYKLVARSDDRQRFSAAVEAEASADPDAERLRLTLQPGSRVAGQVQTADGPPSAAQVLVCGRLSGLPDLLSCDQASTDAGGGFSAMVARSAEDVVWVAQSSGYALEVGIGTTGTSPDRRPRAGRHDTRVAHSERRPRRPPSGLGPVRHRRGAHVRPLRLGRQPGRGDAN